MKKYFGMRVLMAIPTILGVFLAVFLIIRMVPGDPASVMLGKTVTPEEISLFREQNGLDEPLMTQMVIAVKKFFTGDLGESLSSHKKVTELLKERFPRTLELVLWGMILNSILGIIWGVVASVYRGRWPDYMISGMSTIGMSLPSFYVAILVLVVLAVKLKLIPVIGIQSENANYFQTIVAPVLTMVLAGSALTIRTTRSSMLEVMGEDFIRTARAKGLSEKAVLFKHGLRNAAIPIATIIGYNLASSFGGSIVIETVFNRPGIGKLLMDAVTKRDYPVVQGTAVFIAILLIVVNLLTDVMYSIIDPRIRVQSDK